MAYVDQLEQAFRRLDPTGAEQFSANAAAYKQQLQDLDDELRSALDAIRAERRVLVSCEGPSPIWPVITALMRPISGPSMPKAR